MRMVPGPSYLLLGFLGNRGLRELKGAQLALGSISGERLQMPGPGAGGSWERNSRGYLPMRAINIQQTVITSSQQQKQWPSLEPRGRMVPRATDGIPRLASCLIFGHRSYQYFNLHIYLMLGSETSIPSQALRQPSPYPHISLREVAIVNQLQMPLSSNTSLPPFNPGSGKAFQTSHTPEHAPTSFLKTSLVHSGVPMVFQTQTNQVVPTIVAPETAPIENLHMPQAQQIFQPTSQQQSIIQETAGLPQQQFMYHPQPIQDPMLALRDSVISKLGPEVQMITYEPNQPLMPPPSDERLDLYLERIRRQNFVDLSGPKYNMSSQLTSSNTQGPNRMGVSETRGLSLTRDLLATNHANSLTNPLQIPENRYSAVTDRTSLRSLHPIKDQFAMMSNLSDSTRLQLPPIRQTSPPQPMESYAKSVSQVPVIPSKILDIIKLYKKKQATSNLQNFSHQRGTPLGPYYIPSKHAYYIGEWMNGLPCGYAKIIYDSNAYFEGFMINGQAFCSEGLWVYPDGSFYVGEIYRSQPQGKGEMVYRDHELVYTGQWRSGKPHGKGVQRFKDGSRYEGFFRDGVKEGQGKFIWADGSYYEGQFRNGFMQGQGVKVDANGSIFEGQFHRNLISGRGTHRSNLGQYKGQFLLNKRHGAGEFKYSNGNTFVGQFKNDYPHGHGRLYMPSGKVIQGQWIQGKSVSVNKISQQGTFQKQLVSSNYNQTKTPSKVEGGLPWSSVRSAEYRPENMVNGASNALY